MTLVLLKINSNWKFVHDLIGIQSHIAFDFMSQHSLSKIKTFPHASSILPLLMNQPIRSWRSSS